MQLFEYSEPCADVVTARGSSDRPLTVIGIAVGTEADARPLDAITAITGGRTFVAHDDVTAVQQVVLAFAGRVS